MPRVQVYVTDASDDGARLDAYTLKVDGVEIWSQSIPSLEARHQRDVCSLLGEAVLAALAALGVRGRGPGTTGVPRSSPAPTPLQDAARALQNPGTGSEPTEGASSIQEVPGTPGEGPSLWGPEPATPSTKTGEFCPGCGSARMIRTGTCVTCQDCGTNSGCS